MPSGEEGAKAAGAQHGNGTAGDKTPPSINEMSKLDQEKFQLHMRLQANLKAAHSHMQRKDSRPPPQPRMRAVTTGAASAPRSAPGPPIVTGLPGGGLPQMAAKAASAPAARPGRAELLAQPMLIHHGPKRPAPPPMPSAALGSARQPGQPQLPARVPSAALGGPGQVGQPQKLAGAPAAAPGSTGHLGQPQFTQAAAAAPLPRNLQQGSQHSMISLSQASAAAHVQLPPAPVSGKAAFPASGGSTQQPQPLQQNGVPQAVGSTFAVLGQAHRDHPAVPAATKQPSPPTADQPSSAAAPAVQAIDGNRSGQKSTSKSSSKSPQEKSTGATPERASTRVLNQTLGSSGSPAERASTRLVTKRKRSHSPEYSASAPAGHDGSLPAGVGSAGRATQSAPGEPSGIPSPDQQVFGPSQIPRGIGPKLDYHRPPQQQKSASGPAAPAPAAAPASRPMGIAAESKSSKGARAPASALPVASPTASPRPVGRPPKAAAGASAIASAPPAASPVASPRPVGRPPKAAAAASAVASAPPAAAPAPASRPVGRPPKAAGGASPAASSPPAPCPIGRPPKTAGGALPGALSPPAPRPIGRPPKTAGGAPPAASSAPAPRLIGRPPKATAAHTKQKFEVKPQGYGAKEDSALSPRKKRIVDWRDAQPSAVLPAGFRQTANQAARPVLLRAAAAAVRPAQAASAPVGQQAQRSVPALPGQAPRPGKQTLHRGGQHKGKSLAALALAADTLVEAGQIGVRMPGDPPSPVELFKGPKPVASSAPGVRFREPISLEDVTDTKQRPSRSSPAEAVYCSQLREAKEVVEAGKKKQQKQLQRLKEQLHVPAALMVRDALRKQAMPKRMQRDGGMPDGPAPDAANGDSIVIKIEGEAGPAISKRGRQLRQVLRVDYPLPNTGLAYKRKGVVRGEKWWNRPGSAGASPKGTAPLQQPAATPPVQKSSPLAKAQAKAAAAQSSVQQSAASAGQRILPKVPSKGRVKLRASRLMSPLPSPRGVALPAEAALKGASVPEEAARLGVPEELARTLVQACLPLTAAVQPKPDMPPPSPDTVKGMPFTVDNRWAWSLDQPCAWEWRVKHGSDVAQHLKTPVPLARAPSSSTAAPAQATGLAAAQSSQLPASASPGIPEASQQKADSGSSPSKASTETALSGPGASTGQPNAEPSGQRAAQVPRGCLTERNASSAKAGPMLPPKPPKAVKKLKFTDLPSDMAEAPSQACTSAITALTQQLGKPVGQAGLPPQPAQVQSTKERGPQLEPHNSATQGAAASEGRPQAAASPVSAQTRSQKQSDAQQSSDKAPQAKPDQAAAGSKGQSSSQSAAANGGRPPGSPDGAPDGARTPGRRGRPPGKRAQGKAVTPSPRKESLRPRREPMVQGFPLSYASAIAITQARELAGGKRTAIARRFRNLAFRCANALRLRHDEAEAPDQAAAQQAHCADHQPPVLNAKPALAAMDGAATQAAEPLPQSAAPKLEEAALALQLPLGERSDSGGVEVQVLEAHPDALELQPDLAPSGSAKPRSTRGQKVNYNLKQLMRKVWKKPDLSTSTRVPASGEYPPEDDCTDVLLRVQHPSAEPAATDFSMSAFCAAAASAAHGPLPRGKRKQPSSNPEAHRLFSLKLEFVSIGIASSSFGATAAGALKPEGSSQQKFLRDDAATPSASASTAKRQRLDEGQRLAQLCAKDPSPVSRPKAPAGMLLRPKAPELKAEPKGSTGVQRMPQQSSKQMSPVPRQATYAPLPQTMAVKPEAHAASAAATAAARSPQGVKMVSPASRTKTPAVTVARPVAQIPVAPAALKAIKSAGRKAAAALALRQGHPSGRATHSQPAGLHKSSAQLYGAIPAPAQALPLPTAACTALQAACLSPGVFRTGTAAVPPTGLLPPPVYTPFQQQALAASVQAMMTPRSAGSATRAPHVMARLRAAMQLATAAYTSAAPDAHEGAAVHSQAPSARIHALSQDLQVSADAVVSASHVPSAALSHASTGLPARAPAGLGLASGLRSQPMHAASYAATASGSSAAGGELPLSMDASKVQELAQAMAPEVAKALPQTRPAVGQHAAGAHGGSPVLDQATLRQLAKELVEPVLNVLEPADQQALAAAQQLPAFGQQPSAVLSRSYPSQAPEHVHAHSPPQLLTAVSDTAPDHAQGSPPESAPIGQPPAKKRRVRVKVVLPPGEAEALPPSSPSLHRAGPPHMQNANPFKMEECSAEAMRWSSIAATKKDMRGLQADAAGSRRTPTRALHDRGMPNGRVRRPTQAYEEQLQWHVEGRNGEQSAKQNADAAVAYIGQLRRDLPPDAYEAMVNVLHHFRKHSLDICAVVDQVVDLLCHPGRDHLMKGFEQYLDKPALARFRNKHGTWLLLKAASQEDSTVLEQKPVVRKRSRGWARDSVVDLTAEGDW